MRCPALLFGKGSDTVESWEGYFGGAELPGARKHQM